MGPMPENVSTFGGEIDSLTWTITVITGVVFVLLELTLLVAILRFRKRNHPTAQYVKGIGWKETRWIFVPVIVVVFLDLYIDERTSHAWNTIKRELPGPGLNVRITGRQFVWTITQPGVDGVLGTADDFQVANDLHVPVDTNVVFDLEAKDVLHSFWVPALRLKQDAVPGRTIRGWFNATKIGDYDIGCAEICGPGHSTMHAMLHVHTKEDYERNWSHPKVYATPHERGRALVETKGCIGCHSQDGSPRVGPSYRGLYGRSETVTTDGVEREVVVDDDYVRRSILQPTADIVKGFQPLMPPQRDNVTDGEIADIISYLKEIGRAPAQESTHE